MRRYETIFIANPSLADEEVAALTQTFSGAIADRKGEILKSESWGKKKLAYEVRKQRDGHYVLLEYGCEDVELPHELERRLRMNEQVIKFMTIRIDNDRKRLAWEEKQALREKERAERRAGEAAESADESGDDRPARRTPRADDDDEDGDDSSGSED